MKNKTKNLRIIILMGALWGICEATIGYGLHFLPYGFSGMFMFPIGMYFMYNAYKKTDNKNAILWVAVIAAMIKCIDFILPSRSPMSVINPATSILLESLVVFAFAKVYRSKRVVASSYALGLTWVLVFGLFQTFMFKPEIGLYQLPLSQYILSLLSNVLVSGTLVMIYLKNEAALQWEVNAPKLSYAIPILTVLLALALELGNSLIV
ncbi:MAG: hypothetical protein WCT23_03845 [Candidatus Neomarinimicrobiota bacterium]